jgi:hypothetical protein
MEVKRSDQEIDLMTLLVKALDFVWANLFLTIFLPVAGALVGWGLSHISENRSESQMMIVTQHLSEPECEFLLAQLEKTDSFPDVTEEQRKGLIVLKHSVITEQRPYSIFNPPPLSTTHVEITLRVKHVSLRKVFENSIIRYLETSQPAVRKKEELAEYYSAMIAQIDHELKSMDELKKQILTTTSTQENADLFTKSVELLEKKIRYQQAARDIEAFQIVKGFDGMNKPKRASPIKYAIGGASVGLGLLILLLFIKYFTEYYRDYHQKLNS